MTDKPLSIHWLSNDHLRAIGLVTTEWSRLEFGLEVVAWQLVRVPYNLGPAITTHIPFNVRLDMTKTILHETRGDESPAYSEMVDLIGRVKELQAKRNRIVHSNWGPCLEEDDTAREMLASATSTKARGKLKIELTHMEASEIEEIAAAISSLASNVSEYMEKHLVSLLAYMGVRRN